MSLFVIKEKIGQSTHFRKYLKFSLFGLCAFLIIIIVIEIASYFYFGYHLQKISPEGVEFQGWYKGEKIDMIAGKVIDKEGNFFKIENSGEIAETEINGSVSYCGEKERGEMEYKCSIMDASEIREGQYVAMFRKGRWQQDPEFIEALGNEMIVRVWDLIE